MSMFDQAREAAQKLAQDHPDQVDEVIKRVGDEVDQRTGSQYSQEIDQAEQAVRDQLGADTTQPQQGGQA